MGSENQQPKTKWRATLYRVIFEADTSAGKFFDIMLLVVILMSVVVVMLDSVGSIQQKYGGILSVLEWLFTILFTIEYLLRLICVNSQRRYAGSFFGVVDLLAVIPTYLSLFLPGSHFFMVIRVVRLLRIFQIFEFEQYVKEAKMLGIALRASRRKIVVFLLTVFTLVIILGSVLYVVEGPERGFTSIPRSIYWAIVTLTTVGYGDLSPKTNFGQTLAAIIMILGYSIIVVPTGFVTVEMTRTFERQQNKKECTRCKAVDHESDAEFCRHCGTKL